MADVAIKSFFLFTMTPEQEWASLPFYFGPPTPVSHYPHREILAYPFISSTVVIL